MSKEIRIIRCAKCGRDIYHNESGDYKNKNGISGSNTRIMKANYRLCPNCNSGGCDDEIDN